MFNMCSSWKVSDILLNNSFYTVRCEEKELRSNTAAGVVTFIYLREYIRLESRSVSNIKIPKKTKIIYLIAISNLMSPFYKVVPDLAIE